jgi:LPS-assembly protein
MFHSATPSRQAARVGMGMVATIWLGFCASDAAAQGSATSPVSPTGVPAATPATDGAEDSIAFAADSVAYDDHADVVTASGTVQLERQAWRLRADRVVWNRTTGRVTADGNVALTNPQGDIAYGDTVELSDTLKDGVVDNLLLVLSEGGRLAAQRGERLTNGDMVLDHAAYTPCPVETADGCPTKPSWQVRAVRVYYDQAHQRVRYHGARIELFGLPVIPMPGLSHPVGNNSGSGLLVPDLRVDRVNGVEIALPYYLSLSPSRDITITPHIYSNAVPMGELEVRGLTTRGAWQAHGYATYSRLVPLNGTASNERRDFRGYIEGSGGFQFDPRWSLSLAGRIATDRTFLRRYDISRDDRLRSTFTLARNGGSSYLTISGWAVQTLRANDSQGQQPIALPLIDFRQRIDDPWLGGLFVVQANTLALTRTSGQDTQRAFVSAQWDWRSLTGWGQEIRLTALGRGDLYHTDDSLLTAVPGYRGKDGWQGRAFASAAVDVSWPLIGALWGGTQQLTPRVQIVATSPVDNVDIPNEDSRAFELDDGNIFALNRFPGYDRYEDNTRITYGVEWTFNRPGLRVSSMLAQSYRLDDKPSLFPNGTGLTSRASDIIGRTTVAFGDFIRLTHQFRLDKDSMAVRRNEVDATIGSRRTYAMIGYSRLNRDISTLGEDLSDREEVRVGGRVQFARYWSLFGSAVVDLTDRSDDPLNVSDGFTPIRHRLGISYDDDCLSIGLTWKRDYRDTGDARSGNTFLLRVAFRNLGV